MNALDNLSIYDLPEQLEAEAIRANIKACCYLGNLKPSWRYDVKYPGNVRRLLKAGYKVYSPKGENTSRDLLVVLPDRDVSDATGRFTPVLLEDNKVIGL